MGDHQNDDVFSFFTTPNDSDFSSAAATPSTLFNPCSYSSSSSSGDESHPSAPSVDDSNKRIDYMIQFLDRRLSQDGNFDAIGPENDADGSDSLPEFVGKCGGTGIFKVPIRSAVHPNRPPSLEVRPHPLRESQIGRFLRTMTSTERQLWAGAEDGGLKVWDFDGMYGSGRGLEVEDTAPYKETSEMEIGSSVVCMIGDEGSRVVWSGHRDGRIRCWKLRDDDHVIEEALSWQAHRGPVLSIAISCYGDIWSGSEGGALKVWPWEGLGKSLSLKMEQRHMAVISVERSYIDPRNQTSAYGFANTLTSDVTFLVSDHTRAKVWSASPLTFALWDARTRDLIKVFNIDGQLENRNDMSAFPDFGIDEDAKMRIATASRKEKSQSSLGFFQRSRNALMGAADAVRRAAVKGGFCDDSKRTEAIVISADGLIWTGTANGVVMRWDGNGNCLQEFSYQSSGILCMFTFCSRLWVGYSNGTVQVLDLEGKLLGGWVAHSGPVIKMAIGGGYLFTLAYHGGIRGWNVTSPGPLDNVLRAELAGKEFLYSRIENLKILAGTWNVGEGRASTDSIVSWLGCAATGVEIVVVGLQEVEMGAGVLAMSAARETVGLEGSPLGQWWMDLIGKTLDEGSSFVRVGSRQLAGLLICVWVRHDLKPHVGDVDAAAVPCGFGRAIGNKGAVGVRLRMYDRILCFVNCHFAAHLEAVSRRNADFDHVYRTMAFSRQSSSLNSGAASASVGVSMPRGGNAVNTFEARPELSEADMIVFLGDFNYRLDDITYDETRDFISQRCFDWLRQKDQLHTEMEAGNVFQGMREAIIGFPPTYKFERHQAGLAGYDSGEKKRIPAWCDRILYRDSKSHVGADCSLDCPVVSSVSQYDACMDVTDSDHKPVRCVFSVKIARVDESVRRQELGNIINTNKKIKVMLGELSKVPETVVSTNNIILQNHDSTILRVTNKSEKHIAFFKIICEGQSIIEEDGQAHDHRARGSFGFPQWLEVSPGTGIIKPNQIAEVSVRLEDFPTVQEYVDGVAQNSWCEDTRDEEVILVLVVHGRFSTQTKNHRIRVRHIPRGCTTAKKHYDDKPKTSGQRSLPFPSPPLNLQSPPRANHDPGTHILALLNNNNGGGGGGTGQDPPHQAPVANPHEIRSFPSGPIRVPSCKVPRGRRLSGEHAVYDVDVRLHGEIQPQLEVTPITKYGSDPQLVVGRQIAVNKIYICYGLKGGNIRVLNINTALRALFRGHSQRVTDMAFFAQDVHLLASVSLDGKVFVWKISEGSEGDDDPQITGKISLALQILGHEDAKHPRVCWHSHKQEILVVSIGKHVLLIDTTKVGRGEVFSAEAPIQCHLDKLIDGVKIVGKHDGEVTDLSMCQWMITRLVSSSVDGTVKIWQDFKAQPVAVLRPHDGHPVNSATFVTSPERSDHVILITGGPLNREMKIWVPSGEEGWLLPADSESWNCTQKLDLKSSIEPRVEEVFFNQVIALSEAGLLLLANAKRNAIYAVHLDYGSSPADTRMDNLSEFTVTMPILSFVGTNDPPEEPIVKVYCVQTQAIQQYTLDLCLCLPSPIEENVGLEKSDSSVSREANLEGMSKSSGMMLTDLPSVDSVPKPSILVNRSQGAITSSYPAGSAPGETSAPVIVPSNSEPRTSGLLSDTSATGSAYATSPQLPLSPRLSSKLSGYQTPVDVIEPTLPHHDFGGQGPPSEFSVAVGEKNLEESSRSKDKDVTPDDDVSGMRSPQAFFKHPTHLVTPSEFLMRVSSAEDKKDRDANIQDVNIDSRDTEVEVKEVGESSSTQNGEINYNEETDHRTSVSKEKIFYSQTSNLSTEMARDCYPSTESEDSKAYEQSVQAGDNNLDSRDVSRKLPESVSSSGLPQSAATNSKGKKQKSKTSQDPGLSSTSSNVANLADTYNEQTQSSSQPILALQETMNQMMVLQKEMTRQLPNAVNGAVTKEGKRIEVALGRVVERSSKSNADALWARLQEETVKNEKAMRDNSQQIVNALTNFMSKELNAMFEKTIKKEFATIVPAIARALTPAIEKTVSSSITESFQRGLGDKAVNQLDKSVNSKLEATITKQIQTQFQTSGRQALQEALRSGLEASLIPSFERSCKTMFEQVDTAFQKGMAEHTNAAQQRFDAGHSQLAHTLKETITSASSVAQALSRELAESQRNRLALAAAGANSSGSNALVSQRSSGPLSALLEKVEADPIAELSRLISERKYEESFTSALQRSDVSIVSWLCSQVDLHGLLAMNPLPLSQGVLLSLLQQLACDITKDTSRKLAWMTDVVAAINPSDPMVAVHGRPIFEQVYQILHHHRNAPGSDVSATRLIMHVINSMLMACK